MTRINTNVDNLIALNNLERSNQKLTVALTRLSTGLRINNGQDDPAGLSTGEFLRQEIGALQSAVANNNRANNVLATADASLAQISNLLDGIRGLLTTTANRGVLSDDEIRANQLAIDQAVQAVNRIASSTQFAGRKLIDGSLGFQLSGAGLFNGGSATLTRVQVNIANFDVNNNPIPVTVTLTSVARQATIVATSLTAARDSTIELVGNKGAISVQIGSGQSIAAAINGVSDVTGVTASGTLVRSVDYGREALVKIRNIVGGVLATSETSGNGVDAVGTINGQAFSARGLEASLRTTNLDIDVTFSASAPTPPAVTNFTIQAGGARLQLGQRIDIANQINIGFPSVSAANLGRVFQLVPGGGTEDRTLASLVTGGQNELRLERIPFAVEIVEDAVKQVTELRARLGAIQSNTIGANLNSLQVAIENISAARSQLVDADFAEETANLTRSQILVQAGQQALAIANARPRGVLTLLTGQ